MTVIIVFGVIVYIGDWPKIDRTMKPVLSNSSKFTLPDVYGVGLGCKWLFKSKIIRKHSEICADDHKSKQNQINIQLEWKVMGRLGHAFWLCWSPMQVANNEWYRKYEYIQHHDIHKSKPNQEKKLILERHKYNIYPHMTISRKSFSHWIMFDYFFHIWKVNIFFFLIIFLIYSCSHV